MWQVTVLCSGCAEAEQGELVELVSRSDLSLAA
jgi:hypothetical protein